MTQRSKHPIRIEGQHVCLRPATVEDREPIYRALAQSDVTPVLLEEGPDGHESPLSYAEFCDDYVQHYFDDSNPEGGRCFVIEHQGQAVGQINYNGIDRKGGRAELDIWMFEQCYCGRGYGTEALLLLCAYLHRGLGVPETFVKPSARNARAVRAYEKAGFFRVHLSPAEAARAYGPPDGSDTVYMTRSTPR